MSIAPDVVAAIPPPKKRKKSLHDTKATIAWFLYTSTCLRIDKNIRVHIKLGTMADLPLLQKPLQKNALSLALGKKLFAQYVI